MRPSLYRRRLPSAQEKRRRCSLVTFGGFCILQVIGVVHGVYEHDDSLIVGLGVSFLTCGTVTLLTIVYRIRRLRAAAANPAA